MATDRRIGESAAKRRRRQKKLDDWFRDLSYGGLALVTFPSSTSVPFPCWRARRMMLLEAEPRSKGLVLGARPGPLVRVSCRIADAIGESTTTNVRA